MRRELHALHGRIASTILHVTHDPQEALSLGDRVAVLHRGAVQQVGRPDELHRRPANRFVAGFLCSPPMNLLEGRLIETAAGLTFEWGGIRLDLPPDPSRGWARWKGRPVVLGVRPEDLIPVGEGDLPSPRIIPLPPLRIIQLEPCGFTVTATLEGPGGRLTILTRGCDFLRVGDTMRVAIPWNLSHLFDGSDLGERMSDEA
jgi:multiple sugar transport system ATP-binding protein